MALPFFLVQLSRARVMSFSPRGRMLVTMTPTQLDQALASGDEWLDGKSVTAWFRAKQLLGL